MEETVKSLIDAEQIAGHVCRILMDGLQTPPEFASGTIPVSVAAKILKKAPSWIQAGIIGGWLPIGYATREGKLVKSLDDIKSNKKIDYVIIPKMFWELTGYIWRGEENK